MLKVIIADDEDRICQLIRALIDWDTLGLELSGTAHNGLEALELVKLHKPDILITDIRMPGMSGLELIESVKGFSSELEIIIISGYAHFEYAKNAMKFGVGDYLLKPINKAELNSTLDKIKNKILARQASEEKTIRLIKKNEQDARRLQQSLIEHLTEQKVDRLSYDILHNEYGLSIKSGFFQVFWIKVDDYLEEFKDSGLKILMDKVENLLESSIRPRCYELLIGQTQSSCVGIMNYEPKKQEELRRVLKDCMNQLVSHGEIFGSVCFSIALPGPVKSPEEIPGSVKESFDLIQERLVRGTGRVLERMSEGTYLNEQNFPEKYLRGVKHAIEVMSTEEADQVVNRIYEKIRDMRDVHGSEIFELVSVCANLFLSQVEIPDRSEVEQEFKEQISQCSSADKIFDKLKALQHTYISFMQEKHESDAKRPIRQAKQYIQKHFAEQITLEEVSNVVGLSPAYFSVQFKKAEGEGFAKYLINVRIEQAKVLLRETNISVSEICRKVGYNDLKHFTHTFEKAAGVKPAVYRKLYG